MPHAWNWVLLTGLTLANPVQAMQSNPTAPPVTIPATNLPELDRCHPRRVGEASDCMRRALGERAAAEINTSAGDGYRAAFADLITAKWRLTDAESPVARDLRGLRVYDPNDAAYVLLADMAARVGRYKLDYQAFARGRAARAPALSPLPVAVAKPSTPPGPLPPEQCRRPTDTPDVTIVTCVLNPDRTISRTTSGGSATALPPGATAIDLERCRAMGEVPAGSHLKACYRLPDGRLLRQTARAAPAG